MTAYRNIYQDLPSRVNRVWQQLSAPQAPSDGEDLSVTAMLMAAAAGLAMPFENLRERNKNATTKKGWNDHPAFQDVDPSLYQKSLNACKKFLSQPIIQCKGLKASVLMQCQELRDVKLAAQTGQAHSTLDIQMHDTRFALGILRNALAHNNIIDLPGQDSEIEKLVFFSKNNWCSSCQRMDGWHVLVISVDAFSEFLDAWFDMLKDRDSYLGAAKAVADN